MERPASPPAPAPLPPARTGHRVPRSSRVFSLQSRSRPLAWTTGVTEAERGLRTRNPTLTLKCARPSLRSEAAGQSRAVPHCPTRPRGREASWCGFCSCRRDWIPRTIWRDLGSEVPSLLPPPAPQPGPGVSASHASGTGIRPQAPASPCECATEGDKVKV